MSAHDLRTQAIVLRRTNYGESDRILIFLTPDGKISVLAKGARKEKSKLAGGIEMFCVSDITVHQGKGDLGILTSAKMLHFYQRILNDINKISLASRILKQLSRLSEHVESSEYFSLAEQVFATLDSGVLNLDLVESWASLNLARISGTPINLFFDNSGQKLQLKLNYRWDNFEQVLTPDQGGNITADHIKLMRFMTATPLRALCQVIGREKLAPEIVSITKSLAVL